MDWTPRSAVDELMSFTQGHPQRTVLLAHHLYNLLENPDPPDDLAAAAIDLALDETRDAQQALWDGLGRVERIVLMALADGQAVTGSTVADEHRVARSTLREALEQAAGRRTSCPARRRGQTVSTRPPPRRVAQTEITTVRPGDRHRTM